MDYATSTHPGVQAQLDRLPPQQIGTDVDLANIRALLPALGDPHLSLPPVFHVAGTNGKGSTCAFLRAALEADGRRVHVFTSPHLVRLNERIRLAGRLIEDEPLAALLKEVIDAAAGRPISFFEAMAAAAFLAFSRTPADACVIEVGLGGRLDATNVIETPTCCGIAALGLDHQRFLGNSITRIAAEKAGIAKRGTPLVTQAYSPAVARVIAACSERAGARWLPPGEAWDARLRGGRLHYRDAKGALDLPLPQLSGRHQAGNAALAMAMLRHQDRLAVAGPALAAAMSSATWPARLQRLAPGPLRDLLPPDAELWLDGAHNPAAAREVARFLASAARGRPLHLICGLLANKDAAGVLAAFARSGAHLHAVPVPGHDHHAPDELARIANAQGLTASPAADVPGALRAIATRREQASVVLIAGSLYLAGEVLKANDQLPD